MPGAQVVNVELMLGGQAEGRQGGDLAFCPVSPGDHGEGFGSPGT